MADGSSLPFPAFPFITVDETGQAALVAVRCRECGTSYAEAERLACARCGARAGAFDAFEPSYTGTLHVASIVRRGFPGTPVPFISAVVDLDDGPTLKGILRAGSFEPEEIVSGRRVKVVFDDALGRKDAAGNSYVSHFFEPVEGSVA
jgi:uncharacterized OB-fold protein